LPTRHPSCATLATPSGGDLARQVYTQGVRLFVSVGFISPFLLLSMAFGLLNILLYNSTMMDCDDEMPMH
jgi:hypothetical protein